MFHGQIKMYLQQWLAEIVLNSHCTFSRLFCIPITVCRYSVSPKGVTPKVLILIGSNDFLNWTVCPQDGEQIEFETYCRIEHVVSGTWLHAEQEDHERKEDIATKTNNMSMAGLQWTTAILKKVWIKTINMQRNVFGRKNDLRCTTNIVSC